jgi:hypothetical protein
MTARVGELALAFARHRRLLVTLAYIRAGEGWELAVGAIRNIFLFCFFKAHYASMSFIKQIS